MSETFPPPPPVPPRRPPPVAEGGGPRGVVLLLVVFVASRIQLNEYVLTPGEAQAVGPLVKVPTDRSHRIDGPILLTDVYLTRVNLLTYLPDRLNGDAQMVTATAVLGPSTPPAQLTAQGYLEMAQAQASAKAAALTRLGYTVHEHDAGTLASASPPVAGRTVAQGRADHHRGRRHPTPNQCAFVAALGPHGPGDTVSLSVEQSTVTPDAVQKSRSHQGRAGAAGPPAEVGRCALEPKLPRRRPAVAGLPRRRVQSQQDYHDPFPVSVSTRTIGGPSAGLAMTLPSSTSSTAAT